MDRYDFVVIGSGPAGEKAAAQAAYFGKRVALVERNAVPGGAPVNTGGIPSKTLREAAQYLTGYRFRDVYGASLGLSGDALVELLRKRESEVSRSIADAVQTNLDRHGIVLVRGEATLGPDRTVRVTRDDGSTTTLGADVILIATGSRPFHPAAIPFDDPDVHDSDSIIHLERIPDSMVVIGAGPVGSEYASIFTALGATVTLVDGTDRLMPFLDHEISDELLTSFRTAGLDVRLGSPDAVVERTDSGLRVTFADGRNVDPDMVLFAAGRTGNTEALGLEAVGVSCDDRRRIVVDDRFETTIPGIFAAGDVIGPPALASVSAEQGRVAACRAFDIPFKQQVDPMPPFGIYSIPEIGMVGMTQQAAESGGIDAVSGRSPFSANAKSRIIGTTEGMVKLVVDRADRRLLGVHILGDDAAEMIHLGQALIHAEETVDCFIDSTYNIPTRTEAYKYAAYDVLQNLEN
jgi:NAD(P) transhydrogenase